MGTITETFSTENIFERSLLRASFSIPDERRFQCLWDQAVACNRLDPVSPRKGLQDTLVYSGKGIGAASKNSFSYQIHGLAQYLFGRGELGTHHRGKEVAQAVLLKSDRRLMLGFEQELRQTLRECVSYMPPKNESEEKLLEAFVGHLIGLLPYCYPEEGAPFEIPMKVKGRWGLIPYAIDRKIGLTPDWFSTPILTYGLTSTYEGAPPLLSFLGTTFPAGEGYVATLLSDFTPGMSVGHAAYLMGRKKLEAWMEGKGGIHLYGVSLGGALSFHTMRNHSEKIARVTVYNPPGLYSWDWWGKRYDETGPKVEIYYQKNDLVATMGRFPTGRNVSVYRVFGSEEENFVKAHARVYAGGEWVLITKSDAEYENGRWIRKFLTIGHFVQSFVLFPLILNCYLISVVAAKVLSSIQSILTPDEKKEATLVQNMFPRLS